MKRLWTTLIRKSHNWVDFTCFSKYINADQMYQAVLQFQTMVFSLRIFHRSSISTIIPTIPHILEDTKDFVSRLNQLCDIPDNTWFVTFDVVGLYPPIPYEEGLETMKRYLDKREDKSLSSDSLCNWPKSY